MLLPSAACRDPCWGDGAVPVCSFCLGMACHLRQYCARPVYDKKPSAGQNDGVLERKAAGTGEIGEAVLCIAESRNPSFRRRHEEGEGDEWREERQDGRRRSIARARASVDFTSLSPTPSVPRSADLHPRAPPANQPRVSRNRP